jgi:CheY-like chemotaxis protein
MKQQISEGTDKKDSGVSTESTREIDEKKECDRLILELSRLKEQTSILIVEDNPINRKVVSRHIQITKIPVDAVEDGIKALEALKTKKYDLILMDVQMPKMDGLTATKTIRQKLKMKDIVIIAITAHAMKEDRTECLNAGMNDYITKPFKPLVLYRILFKWLRHSYDSGN